MRSKVVLTVRGTMCLSTGYKDVIIGLKLSGEPILSTSLIHLTFKIKETGGIESKFGKNNLLKIPDFFKKIYCLRHLSIFFYYKFLFLLYFPSSLSVIGENIAGISRGIVFNS